MSNKSTLFELLNNMPDSLNNAVFPALTVPVWPSDVPTAIIRGAIAQIEVVRWLDTFQGIKLSDYIGYVGSLAPSPQAAVMGYLQSNGIDISGASTLAEAIKLIGENSGGGLQGPISEADEALPVGLYDEIKDLIIDYETEIAVYQVDDLPVPIPPEKWIDIVNRVMAKRLASILKMFLAYPSKILLVLNIIRVVLRILEAIEKIRHGSGKIDDLIAAIEALQFNDEVIDLGFLRVLLRGKTLEY